MNPPAWAAPAWFPEPAPPWTRRDTAYAAGVCILAFLVRFGYWLAVRNELWFAHPIVDAEIYHLWARSIAGGSFLGTGIFNQSPLYPYLLAALYAVTGPRPEAAALLQLGFGVASCGLVFLLARRLMSPAAGLLAGVGEACYAPAFFFEATLLTAALIHLLNLLVLWSAYWAGGRSQAKAWLLPGFLLGLSVLARPNALLLLVVLGFWLWKVTDGLRRRLASLLVLTAAVVLMILPVTLRNLFVLHEFVLTVPSGALNFYLGNVDRPLAKVLPPGRDGLLAYRFVEDFKESAERRLGRPVTYSASNRFWLAETLRDIGSHPGRSALRFFRKFVSFLNHYENATTLDYYFVRQRVPYLRWPWLHFGLVMPLAVMGLILCAPRIRPLFPLYGFVAVYLLSNLLFFVSAEYRYGVMPAFFVFAGLGAARLVAYWRQGRRRALLLAAAGCLGLLWLGNLQLRNPLDHKAGLAHAHFSLGKVYERQGLIKDALREFGQARALLAPGQDLNQLAQVTFAEFKASLRLPGQYTVLKGMQDLLPKIMDNAPLLDQYGTELSAHGFPELALLAFRRALQVAPAQGRVWLHTGLALLRLGKPAKAQEAFARAKLLDPALAPEIQRLPPAVFPTPAPSPAPQKTP